MKIEVALVAKQVCFEEFESLMYGRKQKSPRWKTCTHDTLDRMQDAAGAIYVSKFFDQASKSMTLHMIDDLRAAFHEMLVENNWMDKSTKKFSVDETDSYSQMVEKISRFDVEFTFKRLLEPVDRSEYNLNVAVVNAYYSLDSNTI
ncbi:hypothetical protein TELCIR_10917, partial [Teladorsagia circumcincta]